MTTAQQLSMDEALAARDAALERVEAAADYEWKELADEITEYVCRHWRLFTSETIWHYGLPKPREPRAMGPVLKRAVASGWCVPEGFVTCSMASRHAAPVRQYRSLIYGGR